MWIGLQKEWLTTTSYLHVLELRLLRFIFKSLNLLPSE